MLTRIETLFHIPHSHRGPSMRPLADWWRAARHRYRTRLLLAEMDETMLKDIGLTSSEAQFEAEKPFWRV